MDIALPILGFILFATALAAGIARWRFGVSLADLARNWPWFAVALVTTGIVGLTYPQQIGLLMWGLTKLAWAVFAGYWIWRSMHPNARMHMLSGEDRRWAVMARAVLIAACIIAVGLGQ